MEPVILDPRRRARLGLSILLAALTATGASQARAQETAPAPESPTARLRGADEPHGPVIHAGLGEGFVLASADERQSLRIAGLFSGRATVTDDDGQNADIAATIRLARIALAGNLAGNELTYYFQGEFAGTPTLLDMELTYTPFEALRLRFGRLRVPVGRQWITGLGGQMLPDRSVVVSVFGPNRDTGVTVESYLLGGKIEVRGGVYAEAGDRWPMAAFRVAFSPMGAFAYSEDIARREGPTLFSVGLSGYYDKYATAAGGPNTDRETLGLDLALRAGPFAAFAEAYVQRRHLDADPVTMLGASTTVASGMFVQGGVFVLPGKMELYGRYNWYSQDLEQFGADGLYRFEGGLSGYWFEGALKLQARYSYNDVVGDPANTAINGGPPVPQGHIVDVQFVLAL